MLITTSTFNNKNDYFVKRVGAFLWSLAIGNGFGGLVSSLIYIYEISF